jgi:hypothetical protein
MANLIMSELLVISNKNIKIANESSSFEESLLVKFRQEINPFHAESVCKSVNSIISSFENHKNQENLNNFLDNLVSLYEWDQQNQNFMRFFFVKLNKN